MRALSLGAVAAAAALAAGCGSSSGSSESSKTAGSGTTTAAESAGSSVPFATATVTSLHKTVITDNSGRTLYVLTPETSSHLLCTSTACVQAWPPVTVGSASALAKSFPGITGKLGTVAREGGKLQVTVNGQPLYTYVGDSGAGQANGEGLQSFGGTWYAVSPQGAAIHTAEGSQSGGSGGSGGYSY